MASTSIHAVPSSSALPWTGTPGMISAFDLYSEHFSEIIAYAVSEVEAIATRSLRKLASQQEGWRDIAGSLWVVWDGEGFSYIAAGEDAEATARDLEFGTEQQAPTAFLRKASASQANMLTDLLSNRISEVMNG